MIVSVVARADLDRGLHRPSAQTSLLSGVNSQLEPLAELLQRDLAPLHPSLELSVVDPLLP